MTYRIGDLRNLDLNLYNFVNSGLELNGYVVLSGYDQEYVISGIYLHDGHPEDYNNVKIPAISIEHIISRDDPLQIGTGQEQNRRFEIDIYARSDGARDDLGEMVKNLFHHSMTVYDYNMVITGSQYIAIGMCDFDNMTMFPRRDPEYTATKHMMRIVVNTKVAVGVGNSLL